MIGLTFDRGDPNQPKGHALLYFHDAADQQKILATYVVVLPISMDMAKYIPPMLAAQMAHITAQEFSVFAVPPVPEEVKDYNQLRHLGEIRGEDIIDGGSLPTEDVTTTIQQVNEAIQGYAQMYSSYIAQSPAASPQESGVGVDEVLFGLMSERDRLGELSKLVSKLRYASERDDQALMQDTEAEVLTLAKHLPEGYRIGDLLAAAKDTSERGTQLAHLYLDRCYKLCDEDYAALKELDEAIARLQSSPNE